MTGVDAVPERSRRWMARRCLSAHCLRRMFDHYRAHGFVGSPRVLEALLGRPSRTLAEHLADGPAAGRPSRWRPGDE